MPVHKDRELRPPSLSWRSLVQPASDPFLRNRVVGITSALEHLACKLQVFTVLRQRSIYGRDQATTPKSIQVRLQGFVGVREASPGNLNEPGASNLGVACRRQSKTRIQLGELLKREIRINVVDEVNLRLRTPFFERNFGQFDLARRPCLSQRFCIVEVL